VTYTLHKPVYRCAVCLPVSQLVSQQRRNESFPHEKSHLHSPVKHTESFIWFYLVHHKPQRYYMTNMTNCLPYTHSVTQLPTK